MRLLTVSLALLYLTYPCAGQTPHPAQPPVSYTITLPARPFGIVTSADGAWVFAGLTYDSGAGGIAVVQRSGVGYALAGVVPLAYAATGLALTHDGNLLIAAAGPEVYFLDVSGVSSGGASAITASYSMSDGPNAGSVWASITPDDQTLFVCDEDTGQLTVINLKAARLNGFSATSVLGTILLGAAPTATVFSADGQWAYTTVEMVPSAFGWSKTCTEEGSTSPALVNSQGAVVMFNVATAVSQPSQAVTSFRQFVPAGCSPVRLAFSPDGLVLYVTARNNNEVLALDASRFASDPMHAVIGAAPVGSAPVPVACINSGAQIVVGNSNRFLAPGSPQTLDVVDAGLLRAGAGAAAVIRTIPAGSFPRALTLSPDGGMLFLSNYGSNTLQVMDARRLGEADRGRPGPGQ
jgi:DNA-binding beta-propeller fold protein YncE